VQAGSIFSDSDETAVTTPNLSSPQQTAVDNYYSGLANTFNSTTPNLFQAPANSLQQQAYSGAANLGGWQSGLDQGNTLATNVAGAGPNTYNAAYIGAQSLPSAGQSTAQTTTASLFNPASAGTAPQAGFFGATSANAGPASTVNLSGYNPSQAAASLAGPAAQAGAQGYTAAQAAASWAGPAAQSQVSLLALLRKSGRKDIPPHKPKPRR